MKSDEMCEALVFDIANVMDEDLPSFNKRGFLKYFCSLYEDNIDPEPADTDKKLLTKPYHLFDDSEKDSSTGR
ncbi:MAG: hypothetical protein LBT58_02500 [Endomicrobium sp.]|nr:hypothetical protein [Endomicrobium sp.]